MSYQPPNDHPEPNSEAPTARWRGLGARTLMTLLAVSLFAGAGVMGTRAAFTDDVTMAQISVTGGSLDMVANNDTGDTDVAWTGDLTVALTGLAPGDVKTGTVVIENVGDVPYTLTASTAGTDASGCFGYWLRETAATGTTKAGAFPVNFTGFGTESATDIATAAFPTTVTGSSLPDSGADLDWEADDTKTYTLDVRMKSSCTTNGAAGTLNVDFAAAQV